MKTLLFIFSITIFIFNNIFSQDTFSIVAVDSITGEVGSAGASCVDLFQAGIAVDHFLGELIPGIGAINTQAWYLSANQYGARNQMNLGQSPSQIIQWLVTNDAQNQPELRQYGIAAIINGLPKTDAFTGSSTDDHKNHIIGPNYTIQGNILLGQEVLDSMEARFLNEPGELACKLMAALQGAKMIGADSRCATNVTSSLFAFVKVAQPSDVFGSPSFITSVRTANNAGIEPIDSLQTKFNNVLSCLAVKVHENNEMGQFYKVSPNPASNHIIIEAKKRFQEYGSYAIYNLKGEILVKGTIALKTKVNINQINDGTYILKIKTKNETYTKRIIKITSN